MPYLRVVLDTNVLVSALVLRSPRLEWLATIWERGDLISLISGATLAEYADVMLRPKFGLSARQVAALLEEYRNGSEAFVLLDSPEVPECRDPGDIPFLQLSLVASADALVTGDGDLLNLASEFSVPIITPATLRQMLGDTL